MHPDKKTDKPIESKPMIGPQNGPSVSIEHYEGIIPHPKLMREWEELVPGSAKSIFNRFENQSDHRIQMERKVVNANNFKLYVGPVFAFIIAMTAIGGGIWLSFVHPFLGGVLAFSGLASVITPFLVNEIKKSGDKNNSGAD